MTMRTLVTGAGGGIGSAVTARLVADGHEVIAHDLRLPAQPRLDVAWVDGDLTSAGGLARLREAVGEAGTLDAVVAAHGMDGSGAIVELTDARSRMVMEVNFLSVVRLWEAVGEAVERSRGALVSVSSANGLVGEAGNAAYCAAKFALVGWSRALSLAAPAARIRVLCPGCTETPLLRAGLQGMADATGSTIEALTAEYQANIPVGRFGHTDEIAAAAVTLAQLPTQPFLLGAVTGGEVLH